MKDTAPISLGILAVAAIFGLIGGGVAFVMWEFGFIASLVIAAIIALIVIVLLAFGWRDPAPSLQESHAAKRAELDAVEPKDQTTAAAPAPVAPAPAEKVAPAAAPETAPVAAATAAAAPAKAAPKPKAKPKADPAPTADKDYDGDGVVEGTDEGKKPETLNAARDGKADNLKEIKGIGPKLEQLCNKLGFYHFDQIAAWNAEEVAWVDANLEGFKGRVTRDTWVAQAKILAAGGETEFSKKVDKGGVY